MKTAKTADYMQNEMIERKAFNRKRNEALKKLDNAKFGWFHVRAIIVSGILQKKNWKNYYYKLYSISRSRFLYGCL